MQVLWDKSAKFSSSWDSKTTKCSSNIFTNLYSAQEELSNDNDHPAVVSDTTLSMRSNFWADHSFPYKYNDTLHPDKISDKAKASVLPTIVSCDGKAIRAQFKEILDHALN